MPKKQNRRYATRLTPAEAEELGPSGLKARQEMLANERKQRARIKRILGRKNRNWTGVRLRLAANVFIVDMPGKMHNNAWVIIEETRKYQVLLDRERKRSKLLENKEQDSAAATRRANDRLTAWLEENGGGTPVSLTGV